MVIIMFLFFECGNRISIRIRQNLTSLDGDRLDASESDASKRQILP